MDSAASGHPGPFSVPPFFGVPGPLSLTLAFSVDVFHSNWQSSEAELLFWKFKVVDLLPPSICDYKWRPFAWGSLPPPEAHVTPT